MMTVRAIPFAFIFSRRVSGAASRAGTLAPWANGKAGSCFQTWTWGSMMRLSAAIRFRAAAVVVVARKVRRERSDIDRFQFVDDVLGAALVAGAGTFAGGIELDAEPA